MIKAALALASVTGKGEYIDQARDWVEVLEKHYRAEGPAAITSPPTTPTI